MSVLDPALETALTAALERAPVAEDEGRFGNLNALPASIIETARRVSPELKGALLRWLTPTEQSGWIDLFVSVVVDGGADPATFMRGAMLYVDVSTQRLCEQPLDEVWRPLGALPHLTIVPTMPSWEAANHSCGAPALYRPEMRYTDQPPTGVLRLVRTPPTEPIRDLRVAGRRYLASRLARVAHARHELDARIDATVVQRLLTIGALSHDAQKAIAGLAREQAGTRLGVPGFAGPDEWYR